ncbi:MAG TPA: hypothetical protein VFJ92_04830 [Gemmatimonadales bacterium]|nr:hypothetical protein [Gemmatimonadales bacterium]
MPTGEPIGEPEMLRCPMMSGITASGIGSSTKPTTCSRPLGASEAMSASQSSGTLTVTSSRSNTPANSLIAPELRLDTTRCAPNFRASSNLLSLEVNAVTSQPYAAANFTAMWPSPPMPTMPTRLVGLAYIASGLNTVMPPHKSGPASATLIFSGRGTAQPQCARTRLANAPLCPTIVNVDCGHKW